MKAVMRAASSSVRGVMAGSMATLSSRSDEPADGASPARRCV
jgi:hypothetical protein